MQIMLLGAGVLSLFLPEQFVTGLVLIGLTLFNALLGLSQEGKAEASVAALQKMMVVKARFTILSTHWLLVLLRTSPGRDIPRTRSRCSIPMGRP
jgi:magnesium-transporting ATPase (P-type)